MKPVKFYFLKGYRKYIHSSNIFDSILDGMSLKDPKKIDFSIVRTFKNQWIIKNKINGSEKERIIGKYKDDLSLYYILDCEIPVTQIHDYNEENIINRLLFSNASTIVPNGLLEYSFIEKVNCAFKALLQKEIFNDLSKSYFFVRITLRRIPQDGFEVRYNRMISNKFLEGEILENCNHIGFIYFVELKTNDRN